ncbi:hypothetical protein DOY81_000773 [Sarcophaga bullata]|nr:hypothetical protein DOY81_000773 [Sarcophaga bullata]
MLNKWCCIVMLVAVLCGVVMCEEDNSDYTVEIDNFEINKEYDQKYVDWDTLALKQKGRNKFVIQGNIILNLNLGDEQKINLQVFPYDKERKAKGPLCFNIERPICQFIAEDEDIYPGLREKSNLPEPGTCPLAKNEYSIDDYEMKADFLPADTPKGDYLLVFLILDGPKPVAGLNGVITITE